MSFFVYISHTDPIDALTAAKKLMDQGCFPFVPQLNKLVVGRSDAEWTKYYRMWLLRCDCLLSTDSWRPAEVQFANENHIPVIASVSGVSDLKLPPFGELGRNFGEQCALKLAKNENWRQCAKEDVNKQFDSVFGLGQHKDPLFVGAQALMVWDRMKNG